MLGLIGINYVHCLLWLEWQGFN